MRRPFGAYIYGHGPRQGCWWRKDLGFEDFPRLEGEVRADVVVIGAGFVGLNAARVLAKAGAQVVVLEVEQPGWGASGRNGGFCCLGGARANDYLLDTRFGKDARLEWRQTEKDAISHVEGVLAELSLDVDRHSEGETQLAHRARDAKGFEEEARQFEENYGVQPKVLGRDSMEAVGLSGPFDGALQVPFGFALNPAKYLTGLVSDCVARGVQIFGGSPAVDVKAPGRVSTPLGTVRTDRVILGTNGYSSDEMPEGIAGCYLPAQSTVLVTRPLSVAERDAAGWQSAQMCYDTRHLLHYFRLMPDGRFLFGMRGAFGASASAELRARRALKRDFTQMFPAWSHVPIDASWSGLVCLARGRMPFVGPLNGRPDLLAGLCFHGNGVAMGSFVGHLLGQLALHPETHVPMAVRTPLAPFPFGGLRRFLLPPLYAGLRLADL